MATINDGGLATAAGPGSSLVTASFGSIAGSATLTVPPGSIFTGSMNAAHIGHAATLLNNGTVLISREAQTDNGQPSAELYDPTAGTFTETSTSLGPRIPHPAATLLDDGMVLLAAGGVDFELGNMTVLAELYNSCLWCSNQRPFFLHCS